MFSFTKLLTSTLLAIAYAGRSTIGFPVSPSAKFTTHRTRELANGFVLESYHPEPVYETFGEGLSHPHQKRADEGLQDASVSFVGSHLNISPETVHFRSGYTAETARHAYVQQVHDGVTFANAVGNIAYNLENKITAFGSTFVKPTKITPSKATVSFTDAIKKAESLLDGKHNDFPPRVEYLVNADGSVSLVNIVQIRNDDKQTWVEAFMNAHTNELISIVDFVARASYRVLPVTKQYLTEGFETLTDPADGFASPFGWHSDGTMSTTDTAGNNVVSYKGSKSSATGSQSSAGLNFIYVHDPNSQPTVPANANAALTNNFYIINALHDINYLYGFTEAAYNFQNNNRGLGGEGNDRVTASVPSMYGMNNANFATPPDGAGGHMNMYLWDLSSPKKDGSLENDIIVHELTHGTSNRLTGGGTGRCLQSTEARGMGEGWSDVMADWVTLKSDQVPDFELGGYVYGRNIRSFPYSTSSSINPLRYSTIDTLNEVHSIGEVWANLLHNLLAALVVEHGFSADAKSNPASTSGNAVFLHLMLDGLALQPCGPTFVTARNAIIQADVNRYAGANKCLLWKVFAGKGLGSGAVSGRYVDSTSVPAGC